MSTVDDTMSRSFLYTELMKESASKTVRSRLSSSYTLTEHRATPFTQDRTDDPDSE